MCLCVCMPTRLAMKLSPVHAIFWSSFLVLWTHRSTQSESKAPDSYLCQDEDLSIYDPRVQRYNSSGHIQPFDYAEDELEEDGIFSCLLYPTKTLNCSWSFPSFRQDSQCFTIVVICQGVIATRILREEGVGSKSVVLCWDCIDYDRLSVILHVNVSLPTGWIIYTHKYNNKILEVLSPPLNITALFRDGGLMVTWGTPHSPLKCLDYQLDISGQERPINLSNQLDYTEPNADPTHTYRVRMRMIKSSQCLGSPHWSDWSHVVTVEPIESPYKLNYVVIITISLGIPMILLATLLLVRRQRVSDILFPPIPQPSSKYKYFLEKSDAFIVSPPVQSPKYVEEITEVEEAEQSPRKTS